MKRLLLCLLLASPAYAKIVTLQVTLGAGATQITPAPFVNCRWLVFQNNGTHTMRLGDQANVSATRGAQILSGGGSFYLSVSPSPRAVDTSWWYVYGTAGDVLDVVYDDGN